MFERLKTGKVVWYHASSFKDDELEFLRKLKFRDLDVESVRTPLIRSKAEIYKYYSYFILNVPVILEGGEVKTRRVDIFMDSKMVITVTKKPLASLEKLFKRLKEQKGQREKTAGSSHMLLYQIFKVLIREIDRANTDIGLSISSINKEIMKHGPRYTVNKVWLARRNAILFMTMLKPMRQVFRSLTKKDSSILSEREREHFDILFDQLKAVSDAANDYHELLAGIAETSESIMAHRTNEVIKVLTIFSVLVLPLTLFASIYGMNIDLPWQENSKIVFALLGIVLFLEFLVYKYIRWRQ